MAGQPRECMYYHTRGDKVICELCPHGCVLSDGERGKCGVREARGETLAALTYAEVTSVHMDPIEKKPLYHFFPGSLILSLGTWGCNFSCLFCQNWQISQEELPTKRLEPADAVAMAEQQPGNIGIAYTYNEPLIWYEYVYDTAKLAHEAGLKNALVTNGYINETPVREILPLIDAWNIDVKSMSDDFYKRLCGARAGWPRRTAEIAAEGAHVEITNLIIPGENDSDEDLAALVDWVADSLGEDTPVHFSRYHPAYQMTAPPTPEQALRRALEVGRRRLRYVYLGNTLLGDGQDTRCPGCDEVLISRTGFDASCRGLSDGKCSGCGAEVSVITV
ncbi:MAG: AmmeMemoRadiSam system radical SAM enzyme [Armatimonadota bacterium]